jgi:hypothetical protein
MENMNISGYVEPLMNNRFIVEFSGKFKIENYTEQIVSKIKRPSYLVSTNSWQIMEIEFLDLINPSISKNIINNIKNIDDEPFELKIHLLDPAGFKIFTHVYNVKRIKSVNFSDLNYSDSNIQKITLLLEIDDFNVLSFQ